GPGALSVECINGKCLDVCNGMTAEQCDTSTQACEPLDTPQNCGACGDDRMGTACVVDPMGGAFTCQQGNCGPGQVDCAGFCLPTNTNASCGSSCETLSICGVGTCVGGVCDCLNGEICLPGFDCDAAG